jgi:uncharacterized membrane protein
MQGLFTPGAVLRRFLIVGGLIAATVGMQLANGSTLPHFAVHVHAPRLQLLREAGFAIQLHVAGATLALLVGTMLLAGRKGSGLHKLLGWSWVIAMAVVAASSFFIQVLQHGHLTLLHLLSGWVLMALPFAIIAVRRGNVRAHRRTMTGMFIGGLLVAGLFSFAPGRLMFQIFFG